MRYVTTMPMTAPAAGQHFLEHVQLATHTDARWNDLASLRAGQGPAMTAFTGAVGDEPGAEVDAVARGRSQPGGYGFRRHPTRPLSHIHRVARREAGRGRRQPWPTCHERRLSSSISIEVRPACRMAMP